MHELLLYGQVSKGRHEQVVKILAGVAAMQPRRVLKRHVVYKPQREPEEPGLVNKRGGTQSIAAKNTKQAGKTDLYFTQLVQRLTEEDFGSIVSTEQALTVEGLPKWTYEFNDLPEAGNRGGALVRMTNSTDIVGGDPHAYVTSLGNQFVSEYYIEGHLFVHENINIYLHRVLHEPGVRSLETEPKQQLPGFDALQPLDPSGAYMLEAKVRVQDINNTAVTEAAAEELRRFKTQMKGCVTMNIPDRLAMDTRIRYRPQVAQPPRKPAQPMTAR
ncbi:hypothetical protein K491DRAFT_777657 [Lophiostoma macrostomum CBS 122681]|uniref:Mediator of RNA polymerase II transcription subunit 18 n=1 Tax=Lophiostoma macrostomum CBS 122681 TaxID=1314788 RepID=A0A6A6TBZ6_9PLEO|nr:hypothetical protein K491DRAFT_777657 [Lophiostoma macrostomum CBS 122681]